MILKRKNMMYKLVFTLILMVFVCGTPISVLAETVGAFEVTGGTNGTDYSYADGVLTVLTDTEITIANVDPATSTTDRIVVADGVSANVILNGVNIDCSSIDSAAAFAITTNSNGNVKITLADGTENILTSGNGCAGLQKRDAINDANGSLTINGTGSLVATGGSCGAGIGGGNYGPTSEITINGGNITAIGDVYGAAGIGGGNYASASRITINGGNITAIGGDRGAGIGSGDGCKAGIEIAINGGVVTAIGGKLAAGIGGGNWGFGKAITISGGSVKAIGGSNSDDIGGGNSSDVSFEGPTSDGVTPVYPLVIYNYPCRDITINGKDYQDKHFDENKIYVYLPAGQEHVVMLGDTKKIYTYSEEKKSFVPDVEGFVERMYTIVLNREADVPGLVNWALQLENGSYYASDIAREFVMSDEFELRNLSNSEFVDVLYLAFMDRSADSAGRQNWVNQLDAGYSRLDVLSKFVNSEEFSNVCNNNGVKRGTMHTTGQAFDDGVVAFVDRLYGKALGRSADEDGLWNWVQNLAAKVETAEGVAKYFFGSEEYALKNTTDTVYLQDLYNVFMGRAADESGLAYWEFVLSEGFARDYVLSEFAKSEEFKTIAASYGLE